jgi:signal transduction histidine kinase
LSEQLDDVAAELDDALEELRELARGLHPAVLADGGLRPALKALARRSAVPVRLDVRIASRLPEPIELAAYYVVAETLTNVAKHARATVVDVLADTVKERLRVEIRDDGCGGADFARGSGLVGLSDRRGPGPASIRTRDGTSYAPRTCHARRRAARLPWS